MAINARDGGSTDTSFVEALQTVGKMQAQCDVRGGELISAIMQYKPARKMLIINNPQDSGAKAKPIAGERKCEFRTKHACR